MKFKDTLLLITTLVILSAPACKKDDDADPAPAVPVAEFLFTGAGVVPSTVVFTNASANATSFIWNFGDNTTSVEINPQHVFSTAGSYTVTLTATGPGGTHAVSKTVTVTGPAAPPTKVRITKVTLSAFPLVAAGGAGWDPSDGPDVFFKIRDQNNNVFLDLTASRFNNVTSATLPLVYTLTTPFEITDFNTAIYIELFDYDVPPDANDNMGFVGFLMSQYTTGAGAYPLTVTKTQNLITVKFDLTWL